MILSFFYPFSISQSLLLEVVSIPDEGSSSNTIFESPIKAIPTDSFLFYPPESVFEI
jgi:hypothetical protein